MIKRHEVQVLLDAGFTHRQVAKKTEVSKRTVTRIAQEPPIEGLDEMGIPGGHPKSPTCGHPKIPHLSEPGAP